MDFDGVLNALSRIEHGRWNQEKLAAGWKYGPRLDSSERTHPDLVDWDRLDLSKSDKWLQNNLKALHDIGYEVFSYPDTRQTSFQ